MQVKSFPAQQTVFFVQAGFGINQRGFFSIYLDSRENAGPDGSWTLQLDDSKQVLRMPLWRFYFDENRHAQKLVRLIKGVVFECKRDGLFGVLNLGEACDFGVEEFDGIDGWPRYEDRHKENLLD